MDRKNTTVRSDALRNCVLAIGSAALLLATGCVTTTSSLDETPAVSLGQAKRDLGIEYLKTRRTGMAIREFRASLELEAEDPQTHLWLGEAYRRKGRSAEAEQHLVDAITLAARYKEPQTGQEARLNLSALLSHVQENCPF